MITSSKALLQSINTFKVPGFNPSVTTLRPLLDKGIQGREEFMQRAVFAQEAGAVSLHVDIFDPEDVDTDGKPGNMEVFDHKLVGELVKGTGVPIDVHTMVSPLTKGGLGGFTDYLSGFAAEGASFVSFHWKALEKAGIARDEVTNIIEGIRKANPDTCVGTVFYPDEVVKDMVFPCMETMKEIDFPLFMTVIPGAGGRLFDDRGIENMKAAKRLIFYGYIEKSAIGNILAVDGGITPETISKVVRFGGKWLVVGSYWFGDDKKGYKTLEQMKAAYDALITAAGQI